MNITDYLVEFLKQGHRVGLPQAGILTTKDIDAHYDAESATFFPACRTIELVADSYDNTADKANGDFIQYIADKQFVSLATAEQMWKNYCGALSDKFSQDGNVALGDLGTLFCESGQYRFVVAEGLNLHQSTDMLKPLGGVKHYNADNSSNPFDELERAAFDSNMKTTSFVNGQNATPQPTPVQQPVPQPEPTPAPQPEPTPAPEPEPQPIPESEPQPIPEPEPQPIAEPIAEPEPIPTPEPALEEPSAAETIKQLDAFAQSDGDAFGLEQKKSSKKEKKGGFGKALLWILVALLLLLACAFVVDRYVFESQGRDWVMDKLGIGQVASSTPEAPVSAAPSIEETDNETDLFDMHGVSLTEDEANQAQSLMMSEISPYLDRYLKARKQESLKDNFAQRVSDYIGSRLTETEQQEFTANGLFSYENPQRTAVMPILKDMLTKRKKSIIYTELMEGGVLDRIFTEMTGETIEPEPEPAPKPVAQRAQKPAPAPVKSHIATASKQGFDVIAGFYTQKSNADQLCRQLKQKGCDAYIIDRNGLYYVSMGSAASNTEIEAKRNHIKEWYKGDVTIKKW